MNAKLLDVLSPNVIAGVLTVIGTALIDAHQYRWALSMLNAALVLDNKRIFAYISRGYLFKNVGRYEDALKDYDSAIQLDPDQNIPSTMHEITGLGAILGRRGTLHLVMGNYHKALSDLSLAIDNGIKEFALFGMRGGIYLSESSYEKALADFNHSIELSPKDAWSFSQRSEVYRRMGQVENAIDDINHALELAPNDCYMLAMRSRILNSIGKQDEAERDVANALGNQSKDSWSIYGIAAVHTILGNNSQAISALTEAIHLDGSLREDLRLDPVFDTMQQDPAFQQLFIWPSSKLCL